MAMKTGVNVVARLLTGVPADLCDLEALPQPDRTIATRVALASGHGRAAEFEAALSDCLETQAERDRYRSAVFAADPAAQQLEASEYNPEDTPVCPDLPEDARLTALQEAAATTVGRWLDDYIAFATCASPMSPLAFHIASALFIGSIAIARRLCVRVSVGANTIFANLYMLFIGQSTRPRKTTGLRVARGLLEAAEMAQFLLADRQTPEAFTLDLTTVVPQSFGDWHPERQEAWLKQRAISAQRGWLLEEASHLLDSFNRDYTSGLLPIVLDLYDSSDHGPSKNTINRGLESVDKSYLSIYGVTTYGAMAAHVQVPAHWHNGLWARFALVGDDNTGKWQFWPPPMDYPPALVERLRYLAYSLLPMPQARVDVREVADGGKQTRTVREVTVAPLTTSEVEIMPDAWKQWEKYSRAVSYDMLPEIPSTVPAKFYASYGRMGTMLIKVAIILAAFDATCLPVTVQAAHVYRAQIIVETWRANLHRIFAKTSEVRDTGISDELRMVLAAKGSDWTPRRELLRSLKKLWSDIELEIGDLEASGEIERRPTAKRGPASEEYRLVTEVRA